MKKTVVGFVFLLLITFTVFSLRASPAQGLFSGSLRIQRTEDGNKKRTDYVDANGKITYATDKHYATMIRTYENGHVILEEYFDAEGKPAVQPLGHCAVSRSFNDDGLADIITYLDQNGQAVITSSGYQAIHRTYCDRFTIKMSCLSFSNVFHNPGDPLAELCAESVQILLPDYFVSQKL